MIFMADQLVTKKTPSSLSSDCQQVIALPEEGGFEFCPVKYAHQSSSKLRILPYLIESRNQPCEACDCIGFDRSEYCLFDFASELVGMMEEGCCEVLWLVCRVSMLTDLEVLSDDLHEARVSDESSERTIKG